MILKKFFRAAIAASALFMGLASTAHAELTVYQGDTTGGATYNRVKEDFQSLSAVGTNVIYEALQVTVATTGDYTFILHGDYNFDTFLALYDGAFNPSNPLQNGRVASDDLLEFNSGGFGGPLVAGASYFVVVSGYDNGDAGKYVLSIAGPGAASISPVPEPSTWLMLALGLAAITYAQRRKSQR